MVPSSPLLSPSSIRGPCSARPRDEAGWSLPPAPPPLLAHGAQLSSWGWNDKVGGEGTQKPVSLLQTFLTRKKGTRIFLPKAPENSAVLESLFKEE